MRRLLKYLRQVFIQVYSVDEALEVFRLVNCYKILLAIHSWTYDPLTKK